MNTKGQSISFAWVYIIITLFGLGLLFIVFNQVLTTQLNPINDRMVNDTSINATDKAEIQANMDANMDWFSMMPWVFFGCGIIFIVATMVRQRGMDQQGELQ